MNYHNITTDDMKNGDGLRTVLWVAGCSHHCPGCQNPITWNPDDGMEFDIYAESELFGNLYNPWVSGVTFSGGDPLYPSNREEIFRLAKRIKQRLPRKTVWIYTGYLWEEISAFPIMQYTDVVVDGPFVKDLLDATYHWAGSSNQRVINVQESLKRGEVILHERNCDR